MTKKWSTQFMDAPSIIILVVSVIKDLDDKYEERLNLFEENIQYLKKVLISHNIKEESIKENLEKTQLVLESSNLSKFLVLSMKQYCNLKIL